VPVPHGLRALRDFYLSKDSARGQLLEANPALQRMPVDIALTGDARAAVADDERAVLAAA
jgi:hypothetical protein